MDTQKVREIERLRHQDQIQKLNRQEQEDIQRLKAEMARHGTLQSGATLKALAKIRAEKVEHVIEEWLAIRKELAAKFTDLSTEESLSELLSDLTRLIESSFDGFHEHHAPWLRVTEGPVQNAIRHLNEGLVSDLKATASRRMNILKVEIALDNPARTSPSSEIRRRILEELRDGARQSPARPFVNYRSLPLTTELPQDLVLDNLEILAHEGRVELKRIEDERAVKLTPLGLRSLEQPEADWQNMHAPSSLHTTQLNINNSQIGAVAQVAGFAWRLHHSNARRCATPGCSSNHSKYGRCG